MSEWCLAPVGDTEDTTYVIVSYWDASGMHRDFLKCVKQGYQCAV